MKFENNTSQALQILAYISWFGAFPLVLKSFDNFSHNFEFFIYGIACVVNGIFMYGFSYVVEASFIYIEKNKKEDKKEDKTKKIPIDSWSQRLKEEEESK